VTATGPTHKGWLERFAGHPVAANLVMALMLFAGVYAVGGLNTQFFPDFDLGRIQVSVVWPGASAEDIEDAVTRPLEQELRNLDRLDSITSTSARGISQISLTYRDGTDMGEALERAKARIDQVRELPEDAETPEVSRAVPLDPVASVLVYAQPGEAGTARREALRTLAQRMRDELLDRGIARVDVRGLPERQIAIEVPPERLAQYDLTLSSLADRIAAQSNDLPAGEIGAAVTARQLRGDTQRLRAETFRDLVVRGNDSQRLRLDRIAAVAERDEDGSVRVSHRGQPAVELELKRSKGGDTLEAAATLQRWVAEKRPELPAGFGMTVYDESWSLLKERITLLLNNGLGGLLLVLGALFLLLRGRIAVWVAIGIPTALLAALALLYVAGGSINMISLFAFIMTLGIIVDDAIVVGEEAAWRYQSAGEGPIQAATNAARRMWPPVLCASATTVAAFLPLMIVGGTIGKILVDIPFVVICVILASLIEAFLVLPGHIGAALPGLAHEGGAATKTRLEHAFARLRDGPFRRAISACMAHRGRTLAGGIGVLIVVAGLVAGGRLPFSFFPSPEGNIVHGNAKFAAGTPRDRVDALLAHLADTARATAAAAPGDPLRIALARHGTTSGSQDAGGDQTGDAFGSLMVELVAPSRRRISTAAFVERWRERIERPPGLEALTLRIQRGGPPGRDLAVRLTGAEPERLKKAATTLRDHMASFDGVTDVEDDMPYGREQLLYRVSPQGESLGLTQRELGEQLRAAYAGELAQIFTRGQDTLEVRVRLPAATRDDVGALGAVPIETPAGDRVPLASVATLETRRGFEALRHAEGRLAVQVQGDVDRDRTNANRVLETLRSGFLPRLSEQYGVDYGTVGQAEDQRETLTDMRRGGIAGLALIYLVLAAVFASYAWPLIVMVAIPFGAVGALLGHWLLGLDVTVLSLFGLFGLAGIIVNNSIILVSYYADLRRAGQSIDTALIDASCRRLRPLLLTSLTTIAGLTPLLFEDSLQAQFLIPMAVSITFGLGFGAVLVLFLVPALMSLQQRGLRGGASAA